ncbi:MAG: methyltransferase domain-containing protein [Spirochaetota bacterium]|nr:methyltransferase domain-containing protein [Spirochaetota bacterium]
MFSCPNCHTEMNELKNSFLCPDCGFKPLLEDDILFFNPEIDDGFADYNPQSLNHLYKAEESHFWFLNRKDMIKWAFTKHVEKNERIIEIGAGTGNVTRMLLANGYQDISVGDVHKNGLLYAESYGIKTKYQFDLLKAPFKKHFDAVGMFDVLEHLEQDHEAVKKVYEILKDKGKFILTVPAHKWLWNRRDVVAGHKKRYTQGELKKLLKDQGFEIVEAKSFFVSILPLLYLRRFVEKDNGGPVTAEEIDKEIQINPLTNKVLHTITRIENKLLQHVSPGIGGSILIVARK